MALYGYKVDEEGTGFVHEILASDQFEEHAITIDSSCVDTTHTGATTDLRRGLMLVPDAGVGGRYTELDAGAAGSAEVVVLAENIFGIDDGNQVAKAYFVGTFKEGVLFDDSGTTLTHFTAANCQRIRILENAP